MPNEKKPKTKYVEYLRHAEYYDMQSTFDELYARSQAGEIFDGLMDVILSRENILLAYRNIKSNTGSFTPGTDKLKISDIGKLTADEVTARVRRIVKGGKNGYTPRSVRRKEIPKPNGSTRPLGIPCIWDRLVQQCIKQVMEPTMFSCSMMAQSIGSVISGTTYPSDDPEMLAVEADYADREARLQEKIDNIESSHPGYDEYRYNLDMIGHDPHELAAVLSAVLQGYTRHSAQAELDHVFDAQYQLTLREEIQIRTYTDEDDDEHEYEYRILHVTLTSRSIASLAPELLTPEQMEMYQVYRQTMGNKPLLFGGGSPDTGVSEDLTGVEFINGTRPGNPQLVELAKSQVGNVGGQPYWSWYGFDSRVEWCACFVSWCYGANNL